jgi:nucleoside 2-deoxyribosyltransferase
MRALRKEVGETTVDRDFKFIDQADAVVVYYPKKVDSKGVDSEMRHAVETGKPIFLYCPEDLGGGPFQVPANQVRSNPEDFMNLLKEELGPKMKGEHHD